MKNYKEFIKENYSKDFIVEDKHIQNNEMINIPEHVKGDFIVGHKNITSLKNCPKTVGGKFTVFNCNITEIDYFPERVGTSVSISRCKLTSLKGLPKKVNDDLYLNHNKLTNLDFCPEYIGGVLSIKHNNLKNLKGIANYIGVGINVEDKFEIEKKFATFSSYTNYYADLLQFCLKNNIDLNVIDWDGNLTEDMLKSGKGIQKFGL